MRRAALPSIVGAQLILSTDHIGQSRHILQSWIVRPLVINKFEFRNGVGLVVRKLPRGSRALLVVLRGSIG